MFPYQVNIRFFVGTVALAQVPVHTEFLYQNGKEARGVSCSIIILLGNLVYILFFLTSLAGKVPVFEE